MGHPLSQTLFTSLYIDNLLSSKYTGVESFQANKGGSITLQVLQAYCLGLIKTCNHVNNRVKSEHFYEVSIPILDRKRKLTLNIGRRLCYPYI